MLPLPASLASFDRAKPTLRSTRRLGGSFQAFSRDVFRLQFFLSRSRITNLGVAILVGLLLISASANLKYATRGSSVVEREHDFAEFREEGGKSKKQHSFSEATAAQVVPPSIEETISEASRLRGATHLVVVAGHAIWNVRLEWGWGGARFFLHNRRGVMQKHGRRTRTGFCTITSRARSEHSIITLYEGTRHYCFWHLSKVVSILIDLLFLELRLRSLTLLLC